MSDSLQPHGLYSPWTSLDQNTGVGGLSLLQGIFPTWDQTQVSRIVEDSLSASLMAPTVKSLPTMRETRVRFLGRESPLEKEMAIHSSTLAWKIPWTEEPDRLQSMGSQRVGHD